MGLIFPLGPEPAAARDTESIDVCLDFLVGERRNEREGRPPVEAAVDALEGIELFEALVTHRPNLADDSSGVLRIRDDTGVTAEIEQPETWNAAGCADEGLVRQMSVISAAFF